ncbi:MAG: radical SAM family heme chaperone HemW [Firmicutes bacterium]|nr:radical SAM family heme chaperone HemW [Bacillota bacterium]
MSKIEQKSVYIHVPFCKTICSYCDFCKFYANEKWIWDYLSSLEKEIQDRYMDEEIKTIYIGGGTPSVLETSALKKLFDIIKKFDLSADYEFTFECNLNDLNEDLIKILYENGVNRLSVGIQSFDHDNLVFLNREADYNDAKEKITLCHQLGINNINIDLIYALPNQTIVSLKKDLKKMTCLDINHLSTYSLMIEDNTMLSHQRIVPISEELDAKMYKFICSYLKKRGFKHYEISNFAKAGYESKHNLVYWNNEQYYGFGPGASGYLDNIRYDNTRSLTSYIKGNHILKKEILGPKEIMDYEIILGLRKTSGINVKAFYDKYHVNIQSKYMIEELLECKDLIYKNGNIYINPDKLYIMNEILLKII